jgi:hypothetical protein
MKMIANDIQVAKVVELVQIRIEWIVRRAFECAECLKLIALEMTTKAIKKRVRPTKENKYA